MEQVLLFIAVYLLAFLLYYFTTIRVELLKIKLQEQPEKVKKRRSSKRIKKIEEKDIPTEVSYLVLKYKIDLNKISYRELLYFIALVASFDIAVVVTIVSFLPWLLLQLIVGFILAILLILISFQIIGKHYQKAKPKKGKKKHV